MRGGEDDLGLGQGRFISHRKREHWSNPTVDALGFQRGGRRRAEKGAAGEMAAKRAMGAEP